MIKGVKTSGWTLRTGATEPTRVANQIDAENSDNRDSSGPRCAKFINSALEGGIVHIPT